MEVHGTDGTLQASATPQASRLLAMDAITGGSVLSGGIFWLWSKRKHLRYGVVGVNDGPFRILATKSFAFELHTVKVRQNGPGAAFKTSKSADPRCVWKTALGGLRSNSAHPCFQCQLKTMSSPVPQYFVTNWAGELGVLQSWVCFMLHRSMRCFEENE